ncbi:MAG: hypothetical protein KZY74_17730 [Paenibacillaceae bacterium]|uniref:F0F1-type ATP synthase n=1 Tax=Paenibacillus mellifer TaxID=2937794 RepID=A0A9X1XVJ5_9BACL|nr:hypothetical protein [Paenibacillus mellifer]MBW4841234.1 hypothetical protein [Paenibacillaceae bacterium]MCK8486820.1 hypothetical protein [Paenibacillus mellifer]
MKITDWAILFVLIVVPILWLSGQRVEDLREVNRLETRYTAAIRTAVQDAAVALNRNELQQFESGYGSAKWMRADKEQALAALLQSLYLNFGVADDPVGQQVILGYIPAVVVMDYDGYYLYAADYEGGKDSNAYHWQDKKPYTYSDREGNSIAFTLDRNVTAYDAAADRWVNGLQSEVKSEVAIPLLQDDEQFEAVRRATIVRQIEEDLAQTIRNHNLLAVKLGVNYTFTLPVIAQEEWNNTLNDVGILVFLQGIPVGDHHYNNYAIGGGRLDRTPAILGAVDLLTGMKYYYRASCSGAQGLGYREEEIFSDEREAVKNGYFPLKCQTNDP